MVLTITLVNGNNGQPTPVASASDGQEIQWSSATDLVQLMSGQTFTGLLNPDGTITIPHLATAQHQQNHHHHQQHQLDPNNLNANSSMQQQQHNVAMSSPGTLATTTISSSAPFQYCRNIKLETNGQPSNSLSNLQAISSTDISSINIINNNNNNDINSSAFMNNVSHSQQQQTQSQPQPQSTTQVKKTIQKRLTAKQKQALQQQQQQQQLQLQNQQQQQMESVQSPDVRQSQIISDQSSTRPQQPQVVATVQLPNGQIGQLIAPSGGFWSPNALDLQQLSMAVAAATGTMPQHLSLPIGSSQSAIPMSNTSQQHVQIASNHQQLTQMQQSNPQHINSQGLSASVSQSPSLSTGGGQVANAMIQRGSQQQFQSSNLQITQQQQHPSLQIQMQQQQQSGSQQSNQNLTTASPRVESSPTPLSSQPSKKLKRLACTCPNCRDGDNNRSSGEKKKQHICHFPDCNKVYGKTSHLRAHLRWHSGERPYICGWSFCGKKFTRSDELQRHRRTHTGEKRFQCQECNKRFMRSDHLSKHLKTHLSSKKCGNTSQQASLLDSTQTF